MVCVTGAAMIHSQDATGTDYIVITVSLTKEKGIDIIAFCVALRNIIDVMEVL